MQLYGQVLSKFKTAQVGSGVMSKYGEVYVTIWTRPTRFLRAEAVERDEVGDCLPEVCDQFIVIHSRSHAFVDSGYWFIQVLSIFGYSRDILLEIASGSIFPVAVL